MRIVCLGLCLLTIAGCGGGKKLDLAAVSGKITWEDGTPIAGATVNYLPEDGSPGSAGVTEDDGSYVLRTGTGNKGAVMGPNKVIVTKKSAVAGDFNSESVRNQMMEERSGGAGGRQRGSAPPASYANEKSDIPVRYTNGEDTPLKWDVTGSTSEANFVIEKQ